MTPQESMWVKQVDYNNGWPVQQLVSTQAADILSQRMLEKGWSQLLCPVVVDKDAAISTFMVNKQIAKIFSSILDVYDVLPFRPDLAFDAAWRTFEYTVDTYASEAWGYKNHPFITTIKDKLCPEVLCSLAAKDANISTTISTLLSELSLNSIQYSVNRIFYYKQLSVAPQTEYVYERVKEIINEATLEHIRASYTGAEGFMDALSIRDVSRRFYRLMNNQDADFKGVLVNPLTLQHSLVLLINVILYTSRCERFHGDFYSPFRSTLTKLDTYYNYYFLTVATYILFWCVMHKLLIYKGLPQFVSSKSIKDSVVETFARMNSTLPNDVK